MKWYMYIFIFVGVIIIYLALMFFQNLWRPSHSGTIAKPKDIVITAHRGGAAYAPENSLAAIDRSINAGCESIEIDVHLTADGEIIVCHDSSIDRTTNGKGSISELTLKEIKSYKILDADGNITGETLPTLTEVLHLMDGRAQLLLEIKMGPSEPSKLSASVLKCLEDNKALDWTVIQSFNDSVLEDLHAMSPKLRLEKLLFFKFAGLPLIFDGTISYFSWEKYEYVESFNFFYQGLSGALADDVYRHGKKIRIWTLNKTDQIPTYYFNGIITNYPDLFLKYYGE